MTAKELLERAPIERYEAEVLLAHILGVQRSWLFSHGDEGLASDDEQAFMAHARARASGEPLAYLLGYRDFWSLRLIVDQHVLIPRRETEHLVEWALECLDVGAQKVLDLGTGSGAIALACRQVCRLCWPLGAARRLEEIGSHLEIVVRMDTIGCGTKR